LKNKQIFIKNSQVLKLKNKARASSSQAPVLGTTPGYRKLQMLQASKRQPACTQSRGCFRPGFHFRPSFY